MPRARSTNGNAHFTVFGPFELPVETAGLGAKKIQRRGLKKALLNIAERDYPEQPHLWSKSGLYIFAIRRPGGSIAPYYVGQTSSQTLLEESLKIHKYDIYDDVLLYARGTPLLFLIAPTDTGKKTANRRLILQIEDILIGRLYEMNADMRNKIGKPNMPFVIDGVPLIASQGGMRRGRRSASAAELCRLIGATR
jgi:hypothetical protein